MTRHSSLASTAIDRTRGYARKDEVRAEPEFVQRFVRGVMLKERLRKHWVALEAERQIKRRLSLKYAEKRA